MAGLRSFLRWKVAAHLLLGIVITLIPFILAIVEKTAEEIERRLKDHDIVPDIVEESAECELLLKYVYGYIPNFGNDLNPNDLQGSPFLVRFQRERDEYFTLMMIDPDQPSRSGPEEREWIHWLVVNMDGCSVMSGETLVRYLTPKPEKGTGPHRFIFFVFKQRDGPQDFSKEKRINDTDYDPKKRGHWSTKDFIKRHTLGRPWAATFFYCEYKPPRRHTTALPPEFNFTYQTIHADILDKDIDYFDHTTTTTTRKK